MADTKISALTELTIAADADEFAIVDKDISTTKKITYANLKDHAPKSHGNEAHSSSFITASDIPVSFVCKASNETVNNSDVLQNDDVLLVAVSANKKYLIELTIFFDTGTKPNIKFAFAYPSGTTGLWSFFDSTSNITKDLATSMYRPGGGAGYIRTAHIRAVVSVSSTPGNVVLKWAQNTADVSDTKVLALSTLITYLLN